MKSAINSFVVSFRDYCMNYPETFYSSSQIEKMDNIPENILMKAVFLIVPVSILKQIESPMQEIKNVLYEEFVISVGGADKVKIAGYVKSSEKESERLRFYAWSLYRYTYRMTSVEEIEKNLFLWTSILLPYIYKLNQFCSESYKNNKVSQSLIKEFLDKYSLGNEINNLKDLVEFFADMEKNSCNVN